MPLQDYLRETEKLIIDPGGLRMIQQGVGHSFITPLMCISQRKTH